MIIFLFFSSQQYDVTPDLNRLDETVQMRGHNICFYAELSSSTLSYLELQPTVFKPREAVSCLPAQCHLTELNDANGAGKVTTSPLAGFCYSQTRLNYHRIT